MHHHGTVVLYTLTAIIDYVFWWVNSFYQGLPRGRDDIFDRRSDTLGMESEMQPMLGSWQPYKLIAGSVHRSAGFV